MTLVFFHLPKTGGTSVDKEICRIASENSLKSLSIHSGNINQMKNKATSFFEDFDYIHIHSCGYTQNTTLSAFLAGNCKKNFTILRCPIDLIMSFWRHSLQIAPQFLPRNHSLPIFHDRYPNLEDLINSVSQDGQIDFTQKIFNDYTGLRRLFTGQINEIEISMGCDEPSVDSIIKFFLLEDPMLSKKLKTYIDNILGHAADFELKHLNRTEPTKRSRLNHDSVKILSATLRKDWNQYLRILKTFDEPLTNTWKVS